MLIHSSFVRQFNLDEQVVADVVGMTRSKRAMSLSVAPPW